MKNFLAIPQDFHHRVPCLALACLAAKQWRQLLMLHGGNPKMKVALSGSMFPAVHGHGTAQSPVRDLTVYVCVWPETKRIRWRKLK